MQGDVKKSNDKMHNFRSRDGIGRLSYDVGRGFG